MIRYFLPLAILVAIGALFWYGLSLNPSLVPSPLIGKPAPAFELPRLDDSAARVTHDALRGRVTMVHVWATWCVSCRGEHPVIMDLAARGVLPIVGLNYRDDGDAARRWLAVLGDPYEFTLFDPAGGTAIDWGVYGTPETFIVDRDGIIRFKHVGPLTPELIDSHIVPLVERLRRDEA